MEDMNSISEVYSSPTSPAPFAPGTLTAMMDTGGDRAPPDFSDLPDTVLVEIFKRLPVADRGHLACCCSRLSAVMKCPSVWTDMTLDVDKEDLFFLNEGRMVKSLPAWYWTMISMYGQYLQKVTVVVSSVHIARRSLRALIQLSVSGVLKRVELRFDTVLSKVLDISMVSKRHQRAHPFLDWIKACPCHYLFEETRGEFGASSLQCVVGSLLKTLSPDVEVSCKLPLHKYSSKSGGEEQRLLMDANRNFFKLFYLCSKSKECCSLFKTLNLSTTPTPEERLFPTAQLVSTFPNLEELHLNIINLSDKLLLELSDTAGRRKPLQRLVIRHLDCESHTFPQLRSTAWYKLVKASPALTVECSLIVHKLPELTDVIRRQTPLTKLEVVSRTSDEQILSKLYRLCQRHGSTLRHFELFTGTNVASPDRKQAQGSLKNMVDACPGLQHLVLNMQIHDHVLLDLARVSRQWRTFRFNPTRVIACPAEDRRSCGVVLDFQSWCRAYQKGREDGRLADIKSRVQQVVGFSDIVEVRDFTDYLT